MTKIITTSDDPHSRGTSLIDTYQAVLTDDITVAILDEPRTGGRLCALELAGRINQTSERSDVLYLQDATGAAQIAAELIALHNRADRELRAEFFNAFNAQLRDHQTPRKGTDR